MTSCVIMRSYNIITANNNSITYIIMSCRWPHKKKTQFTHAVIVVIPFPFKSLSLSLSHKTNNNEKDREYVICLLKSYCCLTCSATDGQASITTTYTLYVNVTFLHSPTNTHTHNNNKREKGIVTQQENTVVHYRLLRLIPWE